MIPKGPPLFPTQSSSGPPTVMGPHANALHTLLLYASGPFDRLSLGGEVVRALDLRLEVEGLIRAAALSSATLDELFTHIVQRLCCYNLMALYKSV